MTVNYEEMTDFEINKAVAIALCFDPLQAEYRDNDGTDDVYCIGNGFNGFKHYCDRIEDAWPIIVENKIDLEWSNDGFMCAAQYNHNDDDIDYHWHDKNPLRAAMIILLKIKELEE